MYSGEGKVLVPARAQCLEHLMGCEFMTPYNCEMASFFLGFAWVWVILGILDMFSILSGELILGLERYAYYIRLLPPSFQR